MLPALLIATLPLVPPPLPPVSIDGADGGAAALAESVEDVQLRTSDGLVLAARFHAPSRSGRTRVSGVVLVHPAGGEKSGLDELAGYLRQRGFGVLTLDLRGHGASASTACDWSALDASGREAWWDAAAGDLEAARAFLRERRELQANSWSIVAVGSGARLAVHHALTDATVAALVLVDTQPDGLGERMVADLGRLAGLPTLVVAPKEHRDEATRLQRGALRAGGKSGVEIEIAKTDGEHTLADPATRAVLAAWLRDKLRPRR